jgi:hypothetical protein
MKLTKRGKRVRALLILAGIIFLVWVSGNVWVTDDGGYCFGSMAQCVRP